MTALDRGVNRQRIPKRSVTLTAAMTHIASVRKKKASDLSLTA
jgi:hypothetical protein